MLGLSILLLTFGLIGVAWNGYLYLSIKKATKHAPQENKINLPHVLDHLKSTLSISAVLLILGIILLFK